MNPKIVTKDPVHVVGIEYVGENKNDEIKEMWGKFNSIMKTILTNRFYESVLWSLHMLPEDTAYGYTFWCRNYKTP